MTIFSRFCWIIRILIIFVLIIIYTNLFAQDYCWPTDASHHLTSSFGEYRSGHFHAGIDIKTWGRVGYKVFATRDGYIWKVRVSPFGYGKVIYQVLDTGEIAVYGHLNQFSPRLEKIMKKEQKRQQRYSVTKIFNPGEFQARKGELIAFTGRSGIGYPHLHFELRKDEANPINPLVKGFQVKDTISPVPTELAVIPQNLNSQADGWPTAQLYDLQRISYNSYSLTESIQIWGTIGLAVDVYDQADGARNKFAVYRITLYLDDTAIFQGNYQSFSYYQTDQIFLDRNYWIIAHEGVRPYNLYVEKGNELPFYKPFVQEQGLLYTEGYSENLFQQADIFAYLNPDVYFESSYGNPDDDYLNTWKKPYTKLKPGRHSGKIVIEDYFGNKTSVEFTLISGKKHQPEKQWVRVNEMKNRYLFDDNNYQGFLLKRNGSWRKVDDVDLISQMNTKEKFPRSNSLSNHFSNRNLQMIKLVGRTNREIFDYPVFVLTNHSQHELPTLELETFVRDPFTVFSIKSKEPVRTPVFASLKNRRINDKNLPLIAHDVKNMTISLPSFDLAGDTSRLTVYTRSSNGDTAVLLRKQFFYERVDQTESKTIASKNNDLTLSIPANASHQNLYVSIKSVDINQFSVPLPCDSISHLYHIEPIDVPFLKRMQLSINVDPDIDTIRQIGIYRPSIHKRKWNFVSNTFGVGDSEIKAKIKSLGYFTLLRDDTPPEVYFKYPRNGTVVNTQTPKVRIKYRDDLSNIGGEKNYRLTLDGKFCIAGMDPEMHLIKFQPNEPIHPGNHTLTLWLQDRAGNQTQKSISFIVENNP